MLCKFLLFLLTTAIQKSPKFYRIYCYVPWTLASTPMIPAWPADCIRNTISKHQMLTFIFNVTFTEHCKAQVQFFKKSSAASCCRDRHVSCDLVWKTNASLFPAGRQRLRTRSCKTRRCWVKGKASWSFLGAEFETVRACGLRLIWLPKTMGRKNGVGGQVNNFVHEPLKDMPVSGQKNDQWPSTSLQLDWHTCTWGHGVSMICDQKVPRILPVFFLFLFFLSFFFANNCIPDSQLEKASAIMDSPLVQFRLSTISSFQPSVPPTKRKWSFSQPFLTFLRKRKWNVFQPLR